MPTPAPILNPVSAAWNTVARFDDYEDAQRAVDRQSDEGFPVDKLDIVGSEVRLVERVTGRLTTARAAGAGTISGLWAGLLIGALLALFTTGHVWCDRDRRRVRRPVGRGLRFRRALRDPRQARLQFRALASRQPLRPHSP
jgi:hypothetical protein